MESRIKLYAASLMAISYMDDPAIPGNRILYYEHAPALFPADRIESAALQAQHHAFQQWSKEQGWFNHSAFIAPVTESFFNTMQDMSRRGFLTDEHGVTEDSRLFNFFDNTGTAADLDANISTKGH